MKTPEQIIAEFEKQQADMDAELEKLGVHALGDAESFDEDGIYKDYPPILYAAFKYSKEEFVKKLRTLIAAGEDVNAASPFGQTAVSHCFSSSNFEALRLLIDNGANLDDMGWPEPHLQLVKGIMPSGFDLMLRDSTGRTAFLFACRIGDQSAANSLLHATPTEGQIDTDGEGALMMAARSCDPNMVAWALDQGFDVNARARFGRTALLIAVEQNAVEVARTLLKAGADISLGENISALLEADKEDQGKNQSVFAKATDLIVSKISAMSDIPDTINTPASVADSAQMTRLLMQYGADIRDFESDMVPAAIGADALPERSITPEQFNRNGTVRAGKSNPEAYLPDFWYEQIRTGRSGYAAETDIMGARSYGTPSVPVWSFERFGRTANTLPDGRTVVIAGEHEDYYDSDFCIYADVTVLDQQGEIEHFIYPKDVFPPTDFHTATLVGDHIWIIGSLGYQGSRIADTAQVLRLDLRDFSIEKINTFGADPGWINRHTAKLDGKQILISGGNVGIDSEENTDTYVFDVDTRTWSRTT